MLPRAKPFQTVSGTAANSAGLVASFKPLNFSPSLPPNGLRGLAGPAALCGIYRRVGIYTGIPVFVLMLAPVTITILDVAPRRLAMSCR
jgi:hypothetical protein